MTLANKKTQILVLLLAMLTLAAISLLIGVVFSVIQITEFIFAIFSMGGDTWLR